jgi:hypothetical protein
MIKIYLNLICVLVAIICKIISIIVISPIKNQTVFGILIKNI